MILTRRLAKLEQVDRTMRRKANCVVVGEVRRGDGSNVRRRKLNDKEKMKKTTWRTSNGVDRVTRRVSSRFRWNVDPGDRSNIFFFFFCVFRLSAIGYRGHL